VVVIDDTRSECWQYANKLARMCGPTDRASRVSSTRDRAGANRPARTTQQKPSSTTEPARTSRHKPASPLGPRPISPLAYIPPVVRSADPVRDAAACAAIYDEFVRDTATSFEESPPGADELAARIETISQTHPWLVAEDGGRVVGFAYGSPHHVRAAYRWAADVSVYVEPGRHRRGVGRALYGALFDLLRTQQLLIACAGITLPNAASVALHESFGFVPVGVYRQIGYKLGAWRDVGWWQLELGRRRDGPPPPPRRPAPPTPRRPAPPPSRRPPPLAPPGLEPSA
jgi:L-amino acid N-acyltransferase YncA